jgi:starch phosphorylase
MNSFDAFSHPYTFDPKYKQPVAYFSMEFGIDQALKIYSGGLGYLAGSHMRSAFALKQNLVGIGILWKYGYYDQVRKGDQAMEVLFQEKNYSFLRDTGLTFEIQVNGHSVAVKAFYLPPDVFQTAPLFLLSTDLPENDHLSRTISWRLYESNVETKIAQYMLLGLGGARLLEEIGYTPEVYHMNEAHALPAAFHLYNAFKDKEEVKKRLVFTTHTPVEAGNEKHDIRLLEKMGFFQGIPLDDVRSLSGVHDEVFNQTLVALRLSRLSNGVSRIHGGVAREMWGNHEHISPIIHITNAQNKRYWSDEFLDDALERNDDDLLIRRKKWFKKQLFEIVADQTGRLFDPDALTIVWARRFAGYKRADLITKDSDRFHHLITRTDRPVQIIWAGKPYPTDYGAVSVFDSLVNLSKQYHHMAVLNGYELSLSRALKRGSDIWLNTPRIPREASGTSGMTAAMNASVNFSTFDGWIPEYARDGINAFVIPPADLNLPEHLQDLHDQNYFYAIMEDRILPAYYNHPTDVWLDVVKNSMRDVVPFFDSDRMAHQYYERVYGES